MTRFLKMHGLGNDFAVFDARNQVFAPDPPLARAIADRRSGIGCDQVIVITKAVNGADAGMRIYNADGGEVEACGNAARCVAQWLMAEEGRDHIRLETLGGELSCGPAGPGQITIDMGQPRFGWKDIPLAREAATESFTLQVDGNNLLVSALSMGNPHCVIFVDDAEKAPVAALGPGIEHHPMFPARANVEFVSPLAPGRLRMRVWERGAGITQACGTGACAAAVAAIRRGAPERAFEVVLDGGPLSIEWRAADGHVLMTGPAALSFEGDVDLGTLRA